MSTRFNRISIYALNKHDPDAIVYPSVDGKPVRVTCEDFSSEADFLAFKVWSDENFHEEEKLEHRESNHSISADALAEMALSVPAEDELLMQRQEQAEKHRKQKELVAQMKDKLTEIQFRRLWMYCVQGLDTYEIGRIEGVDHRRISKSILAAKKKIKKFSRMSKNRGLKRLQNGVR